MHFAKQSAKSAVLATTAGRSNRFYVVTTLSLPFIYIIDSILSIEQLKSCVLQSKVQRRANFMLNLQATQTVSSNNDNNFFS